MPRKPNKSNTDVGLNIDDVGLAGALLAQDAHVATETDARVQLLQKENQNLTRKLARHETREDIYINEMRAILADNPPQIEIPKAPAPDTRELSEEIAVLNLGDWHIGAKHDGEEYRFNIELAKERINLAVDKFIAIVRDKRASMVVDELRIYGIGDMVEGDNMRLGHSWEVECPVAIQAMTHAAPAFAAAVVKLAGHFPKIRVVGVPGNHGRNGKPKNDSHPITNWDGVVFDYARTVVDLAMAKNPNGCNIEWDLPFDRFNTETGDYWFAVDYIYQWCMCVVHGEGRSSGGTPFNSIEKMLRKYTDILADPVDYLIMGHVHVDASIPSNLRRAFVNGSLVTPSIFARKDLVCTSWPSQSALFFSEKYGHTSSHMLHLSDTHMPSGRRTLAALVNRGFYKTEGGVLVPTT